MNATRLVLLAILLTAAVAGAGMYYLQVYHFYEEIPPDAANVQLVGIDPADTHSVMFEKYKGIDADSSPIRYRACFELAEGPEALAQTYVAYPRAEPLVAPGWFDCFDAAEIGALLASGEARAFLGQENIQYGIDRVVAVAPDGRAWSWNQINRCGEVVFDGEPAPEGCPPVPERLQ